MDSPAVLAQDEVVHRVKLFKDTESHFYVSRASGSRKDQDEHVNDPQQSVCAGPRVVGSGITHLCPSLRVVVALVPHVPFQQRASRAHVDVRATGDSPPESSGSCVALGVAQCVFYETHQRNQFDRRLAVFTTLNEERYLTLSPRNWLPVLYNALHFVQEELAIRNDAAITLRRFVGVVISDRPSAAEAEPLFVRTVFPALKNALRSKAEPVRAEVLR
ncbi:hypothetical protein L210DRAFT_3506697 [Boletus edulis BED1]|uniref:U3 small nucleolar RNA-associated protein 20 N-terminal domain-containing protein n=1 Tax=Boletus edulis BED1 TaxID=1328754 RepID=A0AAD4BLI9_BOLED|nr:hypothetical protein L210DRAFT_3506697 [Boletus edulis BED1]